MSWTCSRASAIALRLASAARVIVVTPELRENAVHPIPTIAVLSLIDCSGMFTSSLYDSHETVSRYEPQTKVILSRRRRILQLQLVATPRSFGYRLRMTLLRTPQMSVSCDSQLEKMSFINFESSSKFSAHVGSTGTIW